MLRWSNSSLLGALTLTLGLAGPTACIENRRAKDRRATPKPAPAKDAAAAAQAPKAPAAAVDVSTIVTGERFKVEVGAKDPQRGAEQPLVTIVEFSDFECPFCGKMAKTIDEVLPQYDKDVRLVFKHFPLAMHANAETAARASVAAQQEGKFWEMHDLLFANQTALGTSALAQYAAKLGLDPTKFRTVSTATQTAVTVNKAFGDGRVLEVKTTPTLYINGRMISGAKSADALRTIIDEELAAARKLVAAGVPRANVYAKIMEGATAGTGKRPNRDPKQRRGEASQKTNYAISAGANSPVRGASDALVTIVEFNAFGCDACAAFQGNLNKLLAKYPKDVRHVWRNFPETSEVGQAAAIAAAAAHRQKKFWPMHDQLFAKAGALTTDDIPLVAQAVGVDAKKYAADLRDEAIASQLKTDTAVANKVRGTAPAPFVWINGRIVDSRDNPTFEFMDGLVIEERTKAEAFMKKNNAPRAGLYDKMRETWRGYKLIEQAGN